MQGVMEEKTGLSYEETLKEGDLEQKLLSNEQRNKLTEQYLESSAPT